MSSEWEVEDDPTSETDPQHSIPAPFIDNEPLGLNLAPFEEDYGRLDLLFDQFSYQPYVPLPSQSTDKKAQEKDDAQKLIPVCARDSDEAKEFNGTQWKYGQFHLRIIGSDGRPEDAFLPGSWLPKETGVNMRVKIRGAKVSRKLVIEFTATLDSKCVHRAFLEFHVLDHVSGYEVVDMSIKERFGKNASQSRTDMQDSYIIVHFVTNGGIGIGLDYVAPFLNSEDRKLLLFARNLALNFSPDPKSRKHVAFRLNARWIDYTAEDAQTKRKREEAERLRRQVFDFPNGATWNLGPYRNQQGKVMTQWGMMMGRDYIKREGDGIMEFHAQTSFSTLDEARTILAYGSYLEHQRERELAQSFSANPHHVAFIKVAGSIIMALVKFNLPASEDGADRFVPRDGTVIKIGFRPPNKFGLKKTFCNAIAMPNIFNLPYESNALFFVPGANFGFYQKFAVEVGQRVVFLPAAVSIRVPAAGARRQVDAINRLCDPVQERWHKILLNQHAGVRNIIDPFSGLDFESEEVETAINSVLNISGITWTAGQRKVIESLREFPEGLLLIQGFPGTGKTLTLMGIAAVCRLLGIHVIYTTPTHFAGDAACEAADKFVQLSHMSLDVLRVYRPVSEARAFQTHGRETRKKPTEDEEHEDFDPSEFTQMGPMPQSAIQDDSFIPMNVSSESQVLISQLVNNMKEDHFAKSYGVPSKSLESHVIRLAMDEERTLIACYPSEEQIAKSKGDLYDLIEDGSLDPEGEEVDMLAEIRRFISMLQEKSFRQFSDEEKRKALLAFKKAAQLVVDEATFLISTNNNAGDPMIASHFGKNAKAIIQIRDEDFKETEPNSWIFVAKSLFAVKIAGIVSCGDDKQLRPTVLSAYDQPKLNEFSSQLGLPAPTRLSRMGHPTHKLDEQFRYRPVFAEFPNRRTYDGELKCHPSTHEITVSPGYLKAMKELVPTGPAPAVGPVAKDPDHDAPSSSFRVDYGNLVISVKGSNCTVEEAGKSRYNDAHRLLLAQIVLMNHRHRGYKGGDITIITPYTAQLVRIRQTFFRMVQLGIIGSEDVPNVATTDSMQGKESRLVIYDWVISNADRMSDLGFTTDDHRGNVGLTRVTEAMVNILPAQIGDSRFLVQPQERHNYMGELVRPRVPYPCDFISWASQKGLLVEVECPDEQTLMKPPVDRMIRKLALSMTTEPLSRIGWTSTSLWRAATQILQWPFSRKEACAHDDTLSDPDFLGNINVPEERTNPLEALDNEWAAPPDTANGPWHDDHTEPRESSVDETAVAGDTSAEAINPSTYHTEALESLAGDEAALAGDTSAEALNPSNDLTETLESFAGDESALAGDTWAEPTNTSIYHTEALESPAVDEFALPVDSSGPSEISVADQPETAVVEVDNPSSKGEDMARWAGEGSSDWATTFEDTTGDASW